MKVFRSNGKLLITGEYVVLDGAKALAIPTKYGQSLTVEENDTNTIVWKSYDENDDIWFEYEFDLSLFNVVTKQLIDEPVIRLRQILNAAKGLNPNFLNSNQGYNISTYLGFNRKWGLGSSSTLINNIANWAKVDPYLLLSRTFTGSGYDIACASAKSAITYQIADNYQPIVKATDFYPSFKDCLYFVYLNQKQDSREGMSSYVRNTYEKDKSLLVNPITNITEQVINCDALSEFKTLIEQHETIISDIIKQETVKSRLFNDYDGAIKSLGAWGGDFVLATSETNPTHYFKSKGFEIVIPYKDMTLN